MISISGVMFLFGLTWLFAILTFSTPGLRETFQALFTVFNSFQGFFIFLFFCIFNKEAREYWKEVLSCGKYTSQFLHPSQTRYILSSGTGAKKNKKATASTGISSSSVGRSGYASETISKTTDHYESSTIFKQAAANHAEKIPLDYECPKRSTETLGPTTQTFKCANFGEPALKDGASISETTTVIIETSFNKEEVATNDPVKSDTISEPTSKDGVNTGEVEIMIIETPFGEAAITIQDDQKSSGIKSFGTSKPASKDKASLSEAAVVVIDTPFGKTAVATMDTQEPRDACKIKMVDGDEGGKKQEE